MDTAFLLPIVMGVVIIGFMFFSNRGRNVGRNVCNRCSGTGEINEKWPDPNEPSGWHRMDGTCPKCKGKGRVN